MSTTTTSVSVGVGVSRRTRGGVWLRWCLVTLAVISALCVCGPALFWKFNKLSFTHPHSSTLSCPSCSSCKCPPPPSLLQLAPGLTNLSLTDCGSSGASDPDLQKELDKQFVDLLTEELKLQQAVASERVQHMNATLIEARRLASLYQREADKCIAATETCEGATEHAHLLLRNQTKLTLLWENRARQLGWTDTSTR